MMPADMITNSEDMSPLFSIHHSSVDKIVRHMFVTLVLLKDLQYVYDVMAPRVLVILTDLRYMGATYIFAAIVPAYNDCRTCLLIIVLPHRWLNRGINLKNHSAYHCEILLLEFIAT